MFSLPASMKKIRSKMKALEWTQHFPHYNPMGAIRCHGHQSSDLAQNLMQPFLPGDIAPLNAASSSIVQKSSEPKSKTNKAVLDHALQILIMNCTGQFIKNKKAELHTSIYSAKETSS